MLLCAFACLLSTVAGARVRSESSASSDSVSQLDLRTYEAQLDSYASEISKARNQPAELARIRESIPAEWTVRTGQSELNVSTDWLTTALAELADRPKEADVRAQEIDMRLAAMREAAAELDHASPNPRNARSQLNAIFQSKEFSDLHGPTALQLLEERISRWLAARLLSLLSRLHLGAKAGNVFGWSVIAIAFLALCWWLWKRLAVLGPAPVPAAGPSAVTAASRRWLDDSLAAAERGDYREAVHCAYWAVVARLEDSGRLSRDRARTPREALRQLASHPQDREVLGKLTRSFELVWYGYRPASAADWAGARTQLENMGCLKRSTAATATS